MNCTNFTERVESLLDDLLPAPEAQALRAHAASCAQCGDELSCAERFRTLLAEAGRDAMVAAADREAVLVARAEAAAARGVVRPSWFRIAAAAVVVAAFGAGAFLSRAVAPSGEQVVTGSAELSRGERRTVGEGRTVVADDEATTIEVVDEAHVRLVAGSAMFQVEHGRPFSVVTDLGTVEVLGTLFHVARRAGGSVSVGVSSGEVVFRPSKGGAVRKLRAGAALEVSAAGVQVLVSREQVAAAEVQAVAQRQEIDLLRGDVAKKDDEIAALRAGLATAQSASPAADDPEAVWRELGAATRDLLVDPSPDATPDPLKTSIAAFETFQKHADMLREITGGATTFELPWHPAVVGRTADGFVQALAPLVSDADRALAADAIRAAAADAGRTMVASTTQAETVVARLTMFERITAALRDHVGVGSAASVARTSIRFAEGLRIRPGTDGDALRKQFQDIWLRRLGQGDEQRGAVDAVLSTWIAATKSAQASILAEWGDAPGRAFLFPEERARWGPQSMAANPPAPIPLDDDRTVALSLRRIDAKRRLLAPRIEFERTLLSRVDAEQAAAARADMLAFEPPLWTFK